MREIDIGNPQYTRNTLRLLSSGTKLFITFKSKVIWHEEKETQSSYADCFYIISSQPNQRAAPVALKFVWSHPALNLDSLVRRQELNSLLFSNPPNPQHFRATRHSPLSVLFPIWDFYFDISEWHILSARAWTPALMLYITNPCTKRKVLILTKQKGRIYKTKSPRHYITVILFNIIHSFSHRQIVPTFAM